MVVRALQGCVKLQSGLSLLKFLWSMKMWMMKKKNEDVNDEEHNEEGEPERPTGETE